jgi:NAD(P)-dependent dehydrogenase (short-subunit alcohol dehydrogenase family)
MIFMKIVVVGYEGTIGRAVVRALSPRHEIVGVSRHSRPPVDLDEPATVTGLFQALSGVDAVVCCAGSAAFKPLAELTDADFALSLRSKLMGQVNLIRRALSAVKDGGSVTVTSGILAGQPMPGSAAVSLVNAALEGFVRAAALAAPRGVRVNAVSPPWVAETLELLKRNPKEGLPAADVAKAYVAAVEGKSQGAILEAARFV